MLARKQVVTRRRSETLEQRLAMAGNVTAALVGNDLVIDGDVAANAISIVETANDGEFTITGLNDGSGTATSVNGTPNGSATIAGVTGNIVVNLLGGDDALTMVAVNHAGGVTIDAGTGNDTITLGEAANPVSIGSSVTIHAGDDQNVVTLSHVTVSSSFLLDALETAPDAVPNTFRIENSAFQQSATLRLGHRSGSITVADTTVNHRLDLLNTSILINAEENPANGFAAIHTRNVIVGAHLVMRSGASALITADNTFAGQTADIHCYNSYNAIRLQNSRVLGQLSVNTVRPIAGHLGPDESEYDDVSVSGIIVDGAMYGSSSGDVRIVYSNINSASYVTQKHDNVVIETNLFGTLFVSLGGGDDFFILANSIVHGDLGVVHVRYGPGSSDLSSAMVFNSNRIGTLSITGGNETDEVHITYSIINQIFADLDLEKSVDPNRAGSDLFAITGSIVNQQVNLDGSGGFDLFVNSESQLNGLALANFEAF